MENTELTIEKEVELIDNGDNIMILLTDAFDIEQYDFIIISNKSIDELNITSKELILKAKNSDKGFAYDVYKTDLEKECKEKGLLKQLPINVSQVIRIIKM
jgi:hypothetical protein